MNNFYTADQVADMLNMHPKTIRKYIREGKLKATKVGKQWRITGDELSQFSEGIIQTQPEKTKVEIKVSSVIDIPVATIDDSMRIANTLSAIMNQKTSDYGHSTITTQYLESEKTLRVMLWGTTKFTRIIIESIESLTERT